MLVDIYKDFYLEYLHQIRFVNKVEVQSSGMLIVRVKGIVRVMERLSK